MIVGISGTPACGKSTLAKKLGKVMKYPVIHLTDYIKEKKLYDSYDRSSKSYIVNTDLLYKSVKRDFKDTKDVILDSHLVHYFPAEFIQKLIVCTCDIKTLKKRLEKREYSEKKVRENLDAEIMQVCFIDAQEAGHQPVVLDCTKRMLTSDIESLAKKILKK